MDFPDVDEKGSLQVQFYSRTRQDKAKSKAEGRPVFEDVPYIRKRIPGDRFQEIDRPARDIDMKEFPNAWAAFKAGRDQETVSGTPLALLGLSPSRIEELAFFRVKTIEQLASVADVHLQQMGLTARTERQKAKDFLETAKSRAPLMRLEAQVEEKDKRIAALEAMMAKLAAAQGVDLPKPEAQSAPRQFDPITGLEVQQASGLQSGAPAPKRRGRPPKAKPTNEVPS